MTVKPGEGPRRGFDARAGAQGRSAGGYHSDEQLRVHAGGGWALARLFSQRREDRRPQSWRGEFDCDDRV